jgi:hypothetical protein
MILSLEARARGAEARLAQADAGSAGAGAGASTPRKKTRVYIDGCFDLMHFGHRCVYVCVCMCVILRGGAVLQTPSSVALLPLLGVCPEFASLTPNHCAPSPRHRAQCEAGTAFHSRPPRTRIFFASA